MYYYLLENAPFLMGLQVNLSWVKISEYRNPLQVKLIGETTWNKVAISPMFEQV